MAVNTTETDKITVEYVKSCIGYPERQKRTLRALGLKRLGDQVEVLDTDAVRGMLRKVEHLVEITAPGLGAIGDADSGIGRLGSARHSGPTPVGGASHD